MSKWWVVYPEDPDIPPREFDSKFHAQEWADGLCCSYLIEHISKGVFYERY